MGKQIRTKAGIWRQESCGACHLGLTFAGNECLYCRGTGQFWRSPNNRMALYPGGPFLGSYPRG